MMVAAAEHLNTRGNQDRVLAALNRAVDDDERIRGALAVLARLASGPYVAAYVELWIASRAHPELEDALRAADVMARDNVRALFGPAILAKAGPEFDALLDITMYALRGMALDAHLATRDEHRARSDLIAGLEKYLDQALREPRDRR
jgi:hypothetical protein